jgi:hypothetical protein
VADVSGLREVERGYVILHRRLWSRTSRRTASGGAGAFVVPDDDARVGSRHGGGAGRGMWRMRWMETPQEEGTAVDYAAERRPKAGANPGTAA